MEKKTKTREDVNCSTGWIGFGTITGNHWAWWMSRSEESPKRCLRLTWYVAFSLGMKIVANNHGFIYMDLKPISTTWYHFIHKPSYENGTSKQVYLLKYMWSFQISRPKNGKNPIKVSQTFNKTDVFIFSQSQTLNVWYVHLHLVSFYGKCSKIYHTYPCLGMIPPEEKMVKKHESSKTQ